MLAYGLKLVGRARLKEINYRLLIGGATDPKRLEPVIQSFADRQVATNILPGARASIAADRDAGRRTVSATAPYRLYDGHRKGVVSGKRAEVRVDLAGRRLHKKTKTQSKHT